MAISVFLWNSIHMKYFIASSNPSLSVWVILWGYNFLVTSTRLLFFLPPFILCLLIGEFKMLTLVIDKVLARAMCGLSSILLQLLSIAVIQSPHLWLNESLQQCPVLVSYTILPCHYDEADRSIFWWYFITVKWYQLNTWWT